MNKAIEDVSIEPLRQKKNQIKGDSLLWLSTHDFCD